VDSRRVNWPHKGDNASILRKSRAEKSHTLKDSDPTFLNATARAFEWWPFTIHERRTSTKTPEQIDDDIWRRHLEGSPIMDVIAERRDGQAKGHSIHC
jgi:hypothetical protein